MKQLEYTIVGKVLVPADDPQEITEILEKLREAGEAQVTRVRVVNDKVEKKRG